MVWRNFSNWVLSQACNQKEHFKYDANMNIAIMAKAPDCDSGRASGKY